MEAIPDEMGWTILFKDEWEAKKVVEALEKLIEGKTTTEKVINNGKT